MHDCHVLQKTAWLFSPSINLSLGKLFIRLFRFWPISAWFFSFWIVCKKNRVNADFSWRKNILKGVKEIGQQYGFKSVCYGHAGDGNLHINIIKGEMSDDDWNNKLSGGIREIFELCIQLKGTISGEHGIGLVQKDYMDIVFSNKEIELQKGIKKLFDPNNILNPSKIFL